MQKAIEMLKHRRDETRLILAQWPFLAAQKHLDADTTERAYWHHGYYMALNDALRLLQRDVNAAD